MVIFPSLYIQIALTITLIILGAQSTKKAIDITKKENEDAKIRAEKPEDSERQAVKTKGEAEEKKEGEEG